MKTAIQDAVTAGKLTQDKADWLIQGLDKGYWGGSTGGFGFGFGMPGMKAGGFGMGRGDAAALACDQTAKHPTATAQRHAEQRAKQRHDQSKPIHVLTE